MTNAHMLPHHRDRVGPIVTQTEYVFGMECTAGNEVEFLDGHEPFVAALIDDIDAASDHIHLLFYIFHPDETGRRVAEALTRAVKRGVKCRLLADAAGSRSLFRRRGMASELRNAGIEVRAALPASLFRKRLSRLDLRNHRKIAVFDGRIAYAGSHNVVNEMYPAKLPLKCLDLSARYQGPVVMQLQAVFAEDWTFDAERHLSREGLFPHVEQAGDTAVQTVPSGPEEESQTLRRILLTAIASARNTLVLTTPYFVPDEHTILALSMAAHRGVRVHVVVSKRTDYGIVTAAGRSCYAALLDYGVRIHQFTQGMLHAKTLTIDDNLAVIGSANIDSRSFILNFELNTLMYGREITQRLRAIQQCYMDQCHELEHDAWMKRPLWRQYVDDAAALLSPLL